MAQNQQHAATWPDAAVLPSSQEEGHQCDRESERGVEPLRMHKGRAAQSLKDTDELVKIRNVFAQEAALYIKSIPAPCGCKWW